MAAADASSGRWAISWVVAGGVGALVLALFRPLPTPGPASRAPSALLVLVPALGEEAALRDPTPLFLPTARNGAARAPVPVPGDSFGDYPAKLLLPSEDLQPALGPPIGVPKGPAEALFSHPPGNPILGIGRTGATVGQIYDRQAFVEVTSAADGREVLAEPIAHAGAPEPFGPDRRPIEYVAMVDAAGLVGLPMPSISSGSETLDFFFADFLAKTLRLGQRLRPGIYRICVGP